MNKTMRLIYNSIESYNFYILRYLFLINLGFDSYITFRIQNKLIDGLIMNIVLYLSAYVMKYLCTEVY